MFVPGSIATDLRPLCAARPALRGCHPLGLAAREHSDSSQLPREQGATLGVNPEGCKPVSLRPLGELQCLRPTQSRRCARLWGSAPHRGKSRRCARLWGSAPHRGEVPRCPVLLLPPRGKALSPTTAIHVAFGAARRAAAAEATPVVCCDRGSGLRPRARLCRHSFCHWIAVSTLGTRHQQTDAGSVVFSGNAGLAWQQRSRGARARAVRAEACARGARSRLRPSPLSLFGSVSRVISEKTKMKFIGTVSEIW